MGGNRGHELFGEIALKNRRFFHHYLYNYNIIKLIHEKRIIKHTFTKNLCNIINVGATTASGLPHYSLRSISPSSTM